VTKPLIHRTITEFAICSLIRSANIGKIIL
jgi:hypothetical protein